MEPDAELGERRREAGEEQHERENQPDVVRFPHRPDRLRDQGALVAPARAAREQVPHPAAEVRAGEQHVAVEGDDDNPSKQLSERHASLFPLPPFRGIMNRHTDSDTFGLRTICRYKSHATIAPRKQ